MTKELSRRTRRFSGRKRGFSRRMRGFSRKRRASCRRMRELIGRMRGEMAWRACLRALNPLQTQQQRTFKKKERSQRNK
jgi:hypothetical protein